MIDKRLYVFYLFCMLLMVSCKITDNDNYDLGNLSLYRVKIGDKYGFISEKGKIIIEPQFDNANITFSEDLCFAKINDKVGLINKYCEFLVELSDSIIYVSPFEKGIATILLANNKSNVINKDGEYLLNEFESDIKITTDDNEAFIIVKSEQDSLSSTAKRWYICDSKGNQIGERYDSISAFSEGLCAIEDDDRWGYINREGDIVIEPKFDSAKSFSKEGLARVKHDNAEYFIDKKGNKIISADKIFTGFSCNRATVELNGKKYLINKRGNKICEIKADMIYSFDESDSLATIIRNGNASKIDTVGKPILSTKYEYVDNFINNKAFVQKNSKIGIINIDGKEIIPTIYSSYIRLSYFDYGIGKNFNVISLAKDNNNYNEISYFDFDGNLIGKDMPTDNIAIPNKPVRKDFIKYFDYNLSTLDPIEGLYYVTIENYYQNRTNPDINGLNNSESFFIAVIKSSKDEDYNVFFADGSGSWWVNKFVKINNSNQYGIMPNESVKYDKGKYSSEGKFILEDPYNFKFRLEQSHNDNYNFFVTYEFTKDYPPISEYEKVQLAEWTGSGFAIADGYVATNFHVTNGAKTINIKGINGDINKSYKGKVVASDRDNDLAIIRIVDKDYEGIEAIPYSIGKSIVDVGEDVFVLGYPIVEKMGDEVKVTEGIISASSGYKGGSNMYQISVPIQPGNSGGPLFNDEGSVIGVVCAKLDDAENVNYAVKISQLYTLINSSNLGIKISNNTLREKKRSKIIKQVKDFVYLIECSSK